MAGLHSFLEELRGLSVQPPAPEPDVDLKDVGLEEGDAAKFREEEDLRGGAVLKGVVEPGQGSERPREGDLVFLHYSLSDASGDVLLSTRAEHGGAGRPQPFVLGRGRRMLRGMELGVTEMARGERAVLDIQPPYAFLHADSGLPRPPGLRPEARISADVTLTHWFPGGGEGGAKCVGPDSASFLRTLRAGQGWESPRPPFDVVLHATARLASTTGRQQEGEPYFSSTEGQPLACSLGAGQLPPGVEAALGAMMRGQEAVLLCPLAQLRGGSLMPDPPNADEGGGSGNSETSGTQAAPLYGEVQLQLLDFSQVRDMAGDGGVVKRIARKGRGEFPIDCPLEDSRVAVHLRVKEAGAAEWLWDSRGAEGQQQGPPLEFETGMAEVPEAVDMCVRLMLPGEVAALTAAPRYAYEGRGDAPPGLPAGARCEFEVELCSYERGPSLHTVAGSERLQAAAHFKEQGNALFKQGQARLARQKYQKAVKALDRALDLESAEQAVQASALKASCLLNLARCAEREQEWGEALSWCNRALDEDEAYAKAYFRRAVLHGCLGEYDAAAADLAACAQLDPSAAGECEREAARMERRAAAQEARQRSAMKGFLDRT